MLIIQPQKQMMWLIGFQVQLLLQAHMSVCEVLLCGHGGVFWIRVFHNANTKYAAELLPSLLGEEALEVGLKTCHR